MPKVGDKLERAILGDIEFSVIEADNVNHSVDVTEKPVERGEDIADHIKQKPAKLSISGVIVGDDASEKLEKLKKYQREGKLLTYVNRVIYNNVVIENKDTIHDSKTANGYKINMSLKQVRIVIPKEVNVDTSLIKRLQSKKNAGKKQPKEKKGRKPKKMKEKAKKQSIFDTF